MPGMYPQIHQSQLAMFSLKIQCLCHKMIIHQRGHVPQAPRAFVTKCSFNMQGM